MIALCVPQNIYAEIASKLFQLCIMFYKLCILFRVAIDKKEKQSNYLFTYKRERYENCNFLYSIWCKYYNTITTVISYDTLT